jgi:hypothetical protein
MIRGTTPTLTLTIKGASDVDLTQAESVYVSLRQPPNAIDLSGDDLTVHGNVIELFLTQEQSLKFINGAQTKIQVNWTYLDPDGQTVRRAATIVTTIPINEQLLNEVI